MDGRRMKEVSEGYGEEWMEGRRKGGMGEWLVGESNE